MNSKQTETDNFALSALLRALTWVEVLVLILAGGGLFFLPKIAAEQWPWVIAPFNGRFVGAVYLGLPMLRVNHYVRLRYPVSYPAHPLALVAEGVDLAEVLGVAEIHFL